MLTLEELKEKITEQWDEVDLIDFLNLTTKDIVEAFVDKIVDKQEAFENELEVVNLWEE